MKTDILVPPRQLDPQTLDALSAAAAMALLREGQSENTRRSYLAAVRYWAAWFALRYQTEISFPVAPATVIQFIVDHAERSSDGVLTHELPEVLDAQLIRLRCKAKPGALSLATLNHRIAVLSQLHRLREQPNPCEDAGVRQLLAHTRRAYANRGVRPSKKPALTQEHLQKLLATCDDSLRGKRDRALLLFAVASGGRRRSEIVSATVERLHRIASGQFVYILGRSKTDQLAQENADAHKPVAGDAGLALEEWLAASNVKAGAIFRRIRRGGSVGNALNPAAIRKIVIDRAKQAELEASFSAHSLRAGFLTEAGRQNVPLAEAMALSGHVSTKAALGYFRMGNVLSSTASKLFDRS